MAKEQKRSVSKVVKPKRNADSSKGKDRKPSFNRYRDESGPSDFGKSKKTGSSGNSSFREKRDGDKPAFEKRGSDKEGSDFKKPAFKKRDSDSKPRKSFEGKDRKSFNNKDNRGAFKKSDKPKVEKKKEDWEEYEESEASAKPRTGNYSRPYKKKEYTKKRSSSTGEQKQGANDGTTRLNRYISNAGICSRREADDLISSGVIQVNGKTITEMGYKVKPTDIIKYGGQTLKKEKMVYLILNKPKDYITTFDDPQKRKTVLELIQNACKERIYPVGRLDRATTGLLLFTNDGELTKKLTHPRYGVRKIYHVELDKPLKRSDFDKIAEGIELEDGEIKVDEISYVGDGSNKKEVGVELHSGKNRIVRRIFEHMGYNIRKLDRVIFGPLSKKDLPRGRWRILSDAEVGMLKMISTEE
ncbi:MAG: rRNA pseudouridine synthase [Bacteroidetes bacterium]|nr:rRNA pseudouridine synthase [Bacteroidota bacterium]